MIGSYLNSLYSNCKSLVTTGAHNPIATETYFNHEITQMLKNNGFNSEDDLITHLFEKTYAELNPLLSGSELLKIFYLVNSMSEYNAGAEKKDELGRFKFEGSVQAQTGIINNLVWDLVKESLQKSSFLSMAFQVKEQKSAFFLSHDIDSLYGSTLQDGLWALKKKRFDVLFKIFANVAAAKPAWFNIDQIMALESEYDFKSTFYWLVNKGKIDARQTNSDYSISSEKLVSQLEQVGEQGFENGLHKSISNESFATELAKLPGKVIGNRFHYLKYQLPAMYNEIEKSGLKLDASLGFAEYYGFRNNYGYPFSPYNFETKTHYNFIEVPLTIMDGTFQRYLKIPVEKTARTVIDFLEKNKQNALLSILWHNTFFTDYKYKGYKEEYRKILAYLYDQKFNNINQSEIISEFSWKK